MEFPAAIYLDNAATSFPKPPSMMLRMVEFAEMACANPGRSGHSMSIESGRVVYGCRELLAEMLRIDDPLRIAFTKNATEALNVALCALAKPGSRIITSSMEHNSVSRPLRYLEEIQGVKIVCLEPDPLTFSLDPATLSAALSEGADLVVLSHASNVCGAVSPAGQLGRVCRQAGVPFLLDAAQTAGYIDIDVERDCIDILAFTGHKSLYGPQGTGGLYVRPGLELEPLLRGGTGSRSEDDVQPRFMPDSLESGTLNALGLAGLAASLLWLQSPEAVEAKARKKMLSERLYLGLAALPGVRTLGPGPGCERCGIVSILPNGIPLDELAYRLDSERGIASRVGLHCSPWAHRTLGTYPDGALRFSLGLFSDESDVEAALAAVEEMTS